MLLNVYEMDQRNNSTKLKQTLCLLTCNESPPCSLGYQVEQIMAPSSQVIVENLLFQVISDVFIKPVLKTNKIIIVGDFNIHVDNNNDSLSVAFISVLDSIGFSQCVHQPTHCCNHTLDLVSYSVKIQHLIVLPPNPILSDHNLSTFDFSLSEYMPLIKN